MASPRSFLNYALLFVLTVCILFVFVRFAEAPRIGEQGGNLASVAATEGTQAGAETATTTATTVQNAVAKKPISRAVNPISAPKTTEVARVKNPYATPPLSFLDINVSARQALVNILCTTDGGSLRPISGSGVMIDPKGIILTNAHVAQYVLLAQSGRVNLSCVVRTGSPATAAWIPKILYLPPVWLREHVADIRLSHVVGTGEHDYALLYAASAVNGAVLPTNHPFVEPDTREAIGFVGDQIMAAGYPAEFLGGASTYSSLFSSTSISPIKQLMTFGTQSVDVISIAGTIQAQAGSSGGAIINAWNRLVGIITTTSAGATTGERDLRAITLAYINRDLLAQKGLDLQLLLGGDPADLAADYARNEAPELIELMLKQLTR